MPADEPTPEARHDHALIRLQDDATRNRSRITRVAVIAIATTD